MSDSNTQWNFSARYVVLPTENVDTDQIIPARFLTTTDRTGLGPSAFNDWRYLADGSPNPDFVLNRPESQGAEVLVAGHNFGCGSSREHAVWALYDYGFRAAIAPSFGDIFASNAIKNGFLPIVLPQPVVDAMIAQIEREPGAQVTIDLPAQTVAAPDGSTHRFDVDAFSKHCLLEGLDEISYTLTLLPKIEQFEARRAGAQAREASG